MSASATASSAHVPHFHLESALASDANRPRFGKGMMSAAMYSPYRIDEVDPKVFDPQHVQLTSHPSRSALRDPIEDASTRLR